MTACNSITLSTPTRKVNERSSMVVTARFRDRTTNADVTPTNVYWRLDGECGQITDWTSVTPGTTASVTIPSASHQINSAHAFEPRYLSFAADKGLSTEYRETWRYEVRNQAYVS